MKIGTEPRKNELLQHCSPEFQEQVKREQDSKAKAEAKERARKLRRKKLNSSVKSILILFLIWITFAVLYSGYTSLDQDLDQAGWITHNHDPPVWIQEDWLVGEYRDCGMLTTTSPVGIVLSQTARAELPRLFCGKNWEGKGIDEFTLAMPDYSAATDAVWGRSDWSNFDSYFHVLPVRYNGRIDRPDTVVDSWRCQRNSGSLTCNALN